MCHRFTITYVLTTYKYTQNIDTESVKHIRSQFTLCQYGTVGTKNHTYDHTIYYSIDSIKRYWARWQVCSDCFVGEWVNVRNNALGEWVPVFGFGLTLGGVLPWSYLLLWVPVSYIRWRQNHGERQICVRTVDCLITAKPLFRPHQNPNLKSSSGSWCSISCTLWKREQSLYPPFFLDFTNIWSSTYPQNQEPQASLSSPSLLVYFILFVITILLLGFW
jgi:hypothetical protein